MTYRPFVAITERSFSFTSFAKAHHLIYTAYLSVFFIPAVSHPVNIREETGLQFYKAELQKKSYLPLEKE